MSIYVLLVNSPTKTSGAELWCLFSLICAWINGWVKNRKAGDLRRYRAHYDVTVIQWGRGPPEPLLVQLTACRLPRLYLTQCSFIVNWALGIKLQCNFNRISYSFLKEIAFENVFENGVHKMATILSLFQCTCRWVRARKTQLQCVSSGLYLSCTNPSMYWTFFIHFPQDFMCWMGSWHSSCWKTNT